jgi:hypothetical protein
MKRLHIALIAVFALPLLAQTQGSQTSTAKADKAAKKSKKKQTAAASSQPSATVTIPKGAVLDPKDGTYHYTDKNGRKWVYMMTPMGPSRWRDKGPAAKSAAPGQFPSSNRFSDDPNLKAIDQGETVKFVRATPFGPQTWTKKKSELTEDERAMLTNSKPAASTPEPKSGEKTQN